MTDHILHRCKTCFWFCPIGEKVRRDDDLYISYDENDPEHQSGECRINPVGVHGGWPSVWEDQYCGRHSLLGYGGKLPQGLIGSDLKNYLEAHEDDIGCGINDFGDLKNLFNEIVGREAKSE